MTPTPEDIALARQIDELVGCLDVDEAAQLIAAHTAKLRELAEIAEIGRLAVEERRAYHDHDTRDEEYRIARERLADATVAYLAKESKP